MIKCPYCKAKHPENTLFCDECGRYIVADHQEETNPMFPGVSWMEREESGETAEELPSPFEHLGIPFLEPQHSRCFGSAIWRIQLPWCLGAQL